jgi:hypothetical protein
MGTLTNPSTGGFPEPLAGAPPRRATKARTSCSAPRWWELGSHPRVDPVPFLSRGGLSRPVETVTPLAGRIASVE